MKRKNILKFVSLLGIGSFVMLAAASCTSATTPTPNPEPKPKPNPEPKPDPMPNPPSGGMNGGDTNPGNGGGTDNAAQQLAAARTALTTLIDSRTQNTELYVDYAKIQDTLVKAYDAAKAVLDNTASTTQNINQAKTTLEAEIAAAATSKQTFDSQHASLVTAYKELKTAISNEETTLAAYTQEEFSGIKMHLTALYNAGKALTNKTLETVEGVVLDTQAVVDANTKLREATKEDVLTQQKQNATMLADSFVKQAINKTNITGTTNMAPQPGNYSFVGFSVDINTTANAKNGTNPTWNFARRSVWTNVNKKNQPLSEETSAGLTDVSWIYSLTGTGAKYTLEFNYYGPSTGYLYFPYKLDKESDKDMVALQYSLNGATTPAAVEFKAATVTQPAPAGQQSSENSTGEQQVAPRSSSTPASTSQPAVASSETTKEANSADQPTPETTTMNEAPTIDGINVAKVTLTDLKFGQNTIEFSVPKDKVAPMIGNMYLTSSDSEANMKKIYDDLFGNSLATENNAVTVDLLKGYSLAASYIEYIRQFTDLKNEAQDSQDTTMKSSTVYLVGLINGWNGGARNDAESVPKTVMSPNVNGDKRTFTIYVNAPAEGDYSIKGSYLLSGGNRNLKFSTSSTGSEENSITINVMMQNDWNTLGTFDTATNKNIVTTSGSVPSAAAQNSIKTLHLQKGLNKVVIGGTGNSDTPYIGNLVFTLNTNINMSSSDSNAPMGQNPSSASNQS
ncbi:FIVAR domain-containing protein [Mycoplasmoides gallisepticum]|uniref:FIVAR domain-containing protein n=1 Tax=Mycoplasmoides gallisepticum TaxID=2096 RepID=UPI001AD88F2E|nr:FIVAR domain-containing protein [Mycoplasmoides gallisepticum]